ncbi:MAG: SOS response-associated peptidase [Paludibacter sp.]|nr:SOS response-associated peptidase [Paludibacter sp.]
MCFTVSIMREGKLISAEEYYASLPPVKKKKTILPQLPFHNLVSGFSHPALPIITQDGLYLSNWGLIPSWVKDQESANDLRSKTLNAVGETVFEKPSFRKSIASQRCLFPVSGFYEWREVNGVKYPYYIQLAEKDYFSLGSIYDNWINRQTGEMLNTFSIITTPANPLMEKIHNLKKRMPLILTQEDEMKWLDPDLKTEQIKDLIKPFPESKMTAYTISRNANNARNNRDVPGIQDRVDYPELIEADNSLF